MKTLINKIITTIFVAYFFTNASIAVAKIPRDKNVKSIQKYFSVLVSPDGNTMFAIQDGLSYYPSKIYTSSNSGKTWQLLTTDLTSYSSIFGLRNNNTVYLGGSEDSATISLNNSPSLKHLSTDFEDFAYADIDSVFEATNNANIYLGGQDSDDDAAWLFMGNRDEMTGKITWGEPNIGHCAHDNMAPLNINAISGSGQNIYLANTTFSSQDSGICISNNGGETWHMSTTFPLQSATATFATSNNKVYAAGLIDKNNIKTTELLDSDDLGGHWNQIKFNNDQSPLITAISGSSNGDIIYIGAQSTEIATGGLWIGKGSEKFNFAKISFPDGQEHEVVVVSASANGQIALISCKNGTVWRTDDSGRTWYLADIS